MSSHWSLWNTIVYSQGYITHLYSKLQLLGMTSDIITVRYILSILFKIIGKTIHIHTVKSILSIYMQKHSYGGLHRTCLYDIIFDRPDAIVELLPKRLRLRVHQIMHSYPIVLGLNKNFTSLHAIQYNLILPMHGSAWFLIKKNCKMRQLKTN